MALVAVILGGLNVLVPVTLVGIIGATAAGVVALVLGMTGVALAVLGLCRWLGPGGDVPRLVVVGVIVSAASMGTGGISALALMPGEHVGRGAGAVAGDGTGVREQDLEELIDLPSVALILGATAQIGDFDVAVKDIRLDADAAIEAADRRNPPPEGRYVSAVLSVEYTGTTHGNPRDLLVSFVGDQWLWSEEFCPAATSRPMWDVGAMSPGETAEYEVCADIEVDDVGSRSVVVQDLELKRFTAALWDAGVVTAS